MKSALHVALVFTSRKKAQAMAAVRRSAESVMDDDEPPDLLAEYDAEATISAVEAALSRRYRVTRVEGDVRAYARLRKLHPDLVFNISEGFAGPNRESHIPVLCEILGLAYTGSDALTLGICLDKARTKEIMAYYRIPTARFEVVAPGTAADMLASFRLPAMVKPLREGSSMGIRNDSLVRTRAQLGVRVRQIHRAYHQPALVEEFLPGREFTVGVLGNAPSYEILPLVEINHSVLPPGVNRIYGYEAKWVWDDPAKPLPILVCPAKISAALNKRIRALVSRALDVLCVRDWVRVDLRLDAEGNPNLLELNPLPGILPDPGENSALPAAARAAGYCYEELILKVAAIALRRHGLLQ
ncbi:MAG: D-alanine--D-alanine ligase [Verrucomicrobiota bacterium]